jgi:PAS domain-containing protein
LTQILEGNPIATFVIDADCIVIHWNRACEILTGFPAAEMIGTAKHRGALYSHRRELMADLIVRQAGAHEMGVIYGHHFKDLRQTWKGYQSKGFCPNLGDKGKWLLFAAAPLSEDRAVEDTQNTLSYRNHSA